MLKWKKVDPIYPTDHIISSKARELGIWGFTPQYEKGQGYSMRFIMSNEYMRLWFKERELYQKDNYAKQENTKNDSKLKRGFVQRMVVCPKLKTRELPVIYLKKFQSAISKVDNRRTDEEKTKICEKYKKAMKPTVILERYKTNVAATTPKANFSTKDKPQTIALAPKPSRINNLTNKKKNTTSKTDCALIMRLN